MLHGDQFDGVIQHSRWLAHLGDGLYQLALWLNHHFNRLRHRMGLHYWSLSQYLKHKVKNAVSFITDFEEALAGEARRRGLDGVVCGHIHKAELRDVGGILYCNDGDWVESLSALAETRRPAAAAGLGRHPGRASGRAPGRSVQPQAALAIAAGAAVGAAPPGQTPVITLIRPRYATGMLQFTPSRSCLQLGNGRAARSRCNMLTT